MKNESIKFMYDDHVSLNTFYFCKKCKSIICLSYHACDENNNKTDNINCTHCKEFINDRRKIYTLKWILTKKDDIYNLKLDALKSMMLFDEYYYKSYKLESEYTTKEKIINIIWNKLIFKIIVKIRKCFSL